MKTAFVALRTLFFATCFIWLWTWVALSVRVYDRRYGLALPAVEAPGAILMAAGGLLVASCLLAFIFRGQGTPAPFDPPEVFVAVGPYKYLRNPMYLGAWLLLAGAGLYLGSGSMVLFSVLWILVVHVFVVTLEEPGLKRRFGATYEDYCRKVHRWMPW
jgi:protein-S-isoprenylcysteine O-methyltransferase Ste14